jgi:hypothetical protein
VKSYFTSLVCFESRDACPRVSLAGDHMEHLAVFEKTDTPKYQGSGDIREDSESMDLLNPGIKSSVPLRLYQ